jgi:DNA-directed RNA polymerase subunit E'/Rpb7
MSTISYIDKTISVIFNIFPIQLSHDLNKNILINVKKDYQRNYYRNEGYIVKIYSMSVTGPIKTSNSDFTGVVTGTCDILCRVCSPNIGDIITCMVSTVNKVSVYLTNGPIGIISLYTEDFKENQLVNVKLICVKNIQNQTYIQCQGVYSGNPSDKEKKLYYIDQHKNESNEDW